MMGICFCIPTMLRIHAPDYWSMRLTLCACTGMGKRVEEAKDGTPVDKLPSFVAMSRMAGEDRAVSDLLTREKLDQARQAFQTPEGEELPEEDLTWASRLTHDGNGKIEKTINNAVVVLQNDPLLKGKIVTDEFASGGLILGKVPWSREEGKRRWKDEDDAGFYNYMELFYGITGREKLDSALLIVSSQNRINDVKEYLSGLKSDGQKAAGYTSSACIWGQKTTDIPEP